MHEVHLAYAGLMWMPLIVVAALGAWLLHGQPHPGEGRHDARTRRRCEHGQTWIMSFLYIGTFGSFIGYSFALPLVIKNTFPEFLAGHPFIATYLAGLGFVGALIGSVVAAARRLAVGPARRRPGHARGASSAWRVFTARRDRRRAASRSFAAVLRLLHGRSSCSPGMGNGSTYRMIPSIFAALGRKRGGGEGLDEQATAVEFKRQAAAVIGIAGAIGAFGGFLIQVVLRAGEPRRVGAGQGGGDAGREGGGRAGARRLVGAGAVGLPRRLRRVRRR